MDLFCRAPAFESEGGARSFQYIAWVVRRMYHVTRQQQLPA